MRLCLAFALIAGAAGAGADTARLDLVSEIDLAGLASDFGGLSAIVVHDDGRRAHLLNDQGHLFDVWLNRDAVGQLQGVILRQQKFLYVFEEGVRPDTEGMALGQDGSLFISMERPAEVMQYVDHKYWPVRVFPYPDPDLSDTNDGLEALAIDGQGRLVTLPETRPDTPIMRWEDNGWAKVGKLPETGDFRPVSADFDVQGRFYILERAASMLGFRSRIRRMQSASDVQSIETIWQSGVGEFDNLEGMSIWYDEQGATRFTVVSDNNFLHVQQNQLLEFVLKE